MIEKHDKLLSFDEFKERVYKSIDFLNSHDDKNIEKLVKDVNTGFFGIIFNNLFVKLNSYVNKTLHEKMKINELTGKADEILAKNEITDLLCANLDISIKLPIDAAFKLTPVLYKLALEDEKNVPLSSTLFAIICRKITDQGVQKYCA